MEPQENQDVDLKEDLENVVKEGGDESIQTTPPPEPTAIELEAMSEGWMPRDQWKGDPKDWRTAESWIDRGNFMRTIQQLRAENRANEAKVEAAFKTGQKLAEANYNERLAELKEIKLKAYEEGRFDVAQKVEDQIDDLKDRKTEFVQQDVKKQFIPPPEFLTFQHRNSWYQKPGFEDQSLYADSIGMAFRRSNPNATNADLYWHVENKMKQQFPNLYGGTVLRKENAALPGTESGTNRNGHSTTVDSGLEKIKSGMNEMERSIMRTMIKSGTFKNEAEYLKEYAKA